MMIMFVRIRQSPYSSWGIGKAIDVRNMQALVSWFDSPMRERVTKDIHVSQLSAVTLERQTRIYWFDREEGFWRVGRVLDADQTIALVRFSNKVDQQIRVEDLEVRWDRPVDDPIEFLAEKITESPLFAGARTNFARVLIAQRGASAGMSGLISSLIELEEHQAEVVKRVLQDPVQRYLLADEVGLGKTIEAGVLIRQYTLDAPADHRVLVVAPPPLVMQWRRELRRRFLLGHLLGESIRVVSLNAGIQQLLEDVRWANMLVLDEAHHLSRQVGLYTALRLPIIETPRLLLLSATPVIHNERGFLEMLHLLDPHVFPLEGEAAFRERIKHRQSLAEAVAGLVPDNLLQIEVFLDDLLARFPDDDLLRELSDRLRVIVQSLPDESDQGFLDALTALRAHLTETYRLDRRILRNRRSNLAFLTPQRAGLERVSYRCAATTRLVHAIEAWRGTVAASVYGRETSTEAEELARQFRLIVCLLLTAPAQIADQVRDDAWRTSSGSMEPDLKEQLMDDLVQAARDFSESGERQQALLEVVRTEFSGRAKLVIFCSCPRVADAVSSFLAKALSHPVQRHHPLVGDEDLEQPWEQFCTLPEHRLLVCDIAAEEGINLQGGTKVIVHFDLPMAPNRIEQRLGRADRYGSAEPIRSIALCCDDNPYETGWMDYLETGLGVFGRSIASLQYLIDEEVNDLGKVLVFEGIDALQMLTARTAGNQGTAARELRRIEDQDALDALTVIEDSGFANLTDVDGDWRTIAEGVKGWLKEILIVDTEPDPPRGTEWFGYDPFRFCFKYQNNGPSTLIPLNRILGALLDVLDTDAPGASSKRLKTCWYSCRRTAINSTGGAPEGMHLVRWGDELVDRIQHLMDCDDRGRVAALWRMVPGHVPQSDAVADLYLQFDFIVETDIDEALRIANEADEPTLRNALTRRGDLALAPFYHRVWIDETLSQVTDPVLLDCLNGTYMKAEYCNAYRDWNLNQERWRIVEALDLPVMGAWRQWLPHAREAAIAILHHERDMTSLCEQNVARAKQADQGRFAQLRARGKGGVSGDAEATAILLEREERIARGLYAGMQAPRITLTTVVAVFISAQPIGLSDA